MKGRIASLAAAVCACAAFSAPFGATLAVPSSASASLGCTSGYFCWWQYENYGNPYYKSFYSDSAMPTGASYYNDSNQGNRACLYQSQNYYGYLGSYSPGYYTPKSRWAGEIRSFQWC